MTGPSDSGSSNPQPKAQSAQARQQPKARDPAVKRGSVSQEVIRRHRKFAPLGSYWLKDKLSNLASNNNFLDAVLVTLIFLSVATSFPFYPVAIILPLAVVLFIITLFQPFLGLMVLIIINFPIFAYQTPVLAWAFLLLSTLILVYGYMHYRAMIFAYLLAALAFSPAGFLLEIPVFILGVLSVGNKRSLLALLFTLGVIIVLSAATGIQNSGYILYNAAAAHNSLAQSGIVSLDSGARSGFGIYNFSSGMQQASSSFTNRNVTSQIQVAIPAIADMFSIQPFGYLTQMLLFAVAILLIDWYAASSRSKYKGAIASIFGILYPLSFILLSGFFGLDGYVSMITPAISFLFAPAALYILESQNISFVRSLEVRKQDTRMKFGEPFEDLSYGNVDEKFDDIGNYDQIKKELKEAVISPIEQKSISKAYNVQPSKGILFFGPPGTGKTMIMRALANEIHANFYYIKTTDLISAYPGESERQISHIFATARKSIPCVLFFDEIDSLAMSRESAGIDDTHRHALSQLLTEMDGFQKVTGVIMVGATNRPDLLDSAIIRPGRFDRLIYMPLPDKDGRKKIFEIYTKKMPIADSVNLSTLADKTERYSGADIKTLCASVSQSVSRIASEEHKVLEITMDDMLTAIKATKPSTTLAQIEEYRRFKMDFERSSSKGSIKEEGEPEVQMTDVIGLEPAKKAIREAVEVPLLHPEMIKKYGIKPTSGILMFGPPGNGKTMLMKATKTDLGGVAMLELSGSEIAEEGIERANATIKETFDRAKENAPSVIFIDEIDGLVPSRDGASEISVQITSEVLKEIDGIKQLHNVVVIGATNRPDNLDPAMLRPGRFDKLIFVKPPTAANRAALFEKYLSDAPLDKGVDFEKLGNLAKGFTGADIESVCREAKTAAMEQELTAGVEGKVTMDSLSSLIQEMKPSAPDSVIQNYQGFLERYGQR